MVFIGRPKSFRIVRHLPPVYNFIPFENPPDNKGYGSKECLTIVEYEALRLKHYLKLNQIKCAEYMGVSQSTFSRILDSAHTKLTRALVEGKPIVLEGGNYRIRDLFLGYGCLNCMHEWRLVKELHYTEDDLHGQTLQNLLPLNGVTCPRCGSSRIYRLVRNITVSK